MLLVLAATAFLSSTSTAAAPAAAAPTAAPTAAAPTAAISTGALDVVIDGDRIEALEAAGGPSWLAAPTTAYTLSSTSLTATLSAEALPDGQLLLHLTLANPGDSLAEADLRFPDLDGLGTGASSPLGYFFPALGPIVDDEITTHRRYYGGLYPTQLVELHQGDAGLFVITRDPTGRAKTFNAGRATDGTGSLAVEWPELRIEPGASLTLEASIGVHHSDWHEALGAYRRQLRTWYRPAVRPKDDFRTAFNLRQLHLHENSVLGTHPGAFDAATASFDIQGFIAEDVEAFGGVDWVHVFDWGMDMVHGRVGDYNPWSYLGDPSGLRHEVQTLADQGRPTGLYVEGYLLDTPSLVGTTWGEQWELKDESGADYTTYAPSWHVCPAVDDWREHFARRNARRTERRVGAAGLYIDQLGFGYQYRCYRGDHGHDAPADQLLAELGLVAAVRQLTSPDLVVYTEAAPSDVASQWQDGAFTEAVASFRTDARAVPMAIHRFAIPGFKTFELLTQDAPLADDLEGVRLAFFNGEGTRLMGYLHDDDWFSDDVLAEIRSTWRILRSHAELFMGSDPVPLVDTEVEGLYANLFQGDRQRLWTLYNRTDDTVDGTLLQVDSVPGATWTDCWTDATLAPPVVDGMTQLSLSMESGGVGCLLETRPTPDPTAIAWWPLDETHGSTVHDATGSADGVAWPEGGGPTLGSKPASPILGTAFDFDGSGAVSLGEQDALAGLTADFSVAAWVRPTATTGVHRILATEGWDDGGFVFGLTQADDGRQALALTTVGVQDYVLPVVVPADRWTHVAVILDAGATASFYVDGELRGTVEGHVPGLPATGPWWIGSNGEDGGWEGGLDEVQVWSGSLTRGALRQLADIAPPLAGTVHAAEDPWQHADRLTAWWPGFFDPGSDIDHYDLRIGTTAGAGDLFTGSFSGDLQQAEIEGLALPEGTVHLAVTAVDGRGLSSEAAGSVQVESALPPLLGRWDYGRGTVFGEDRVGESVDPTLERDERVSLTAWISPASTDPMTIFGSDQGGWALSTDDGALVFTTRDLEEHRVDAGLLAESWHHIALVFDRYDDAWLYVDGSLLLQGLGTLPAHPSVSGFTIGGGAWPWRGGLDTVRLYDGELRSDQVADIFASASTVGDSGRPGDTAGSDSGGRDSGPGDAQDSTTDGATDGGAAGRGDPRDCACAQAPGRAAAGIVPLVIGLWAGRRRRRRADPRARPGAR